MFAEGSVPVLKSPASHGILVGHVREELVPWVGSTYVGRECLFSTLSLEHFYVCRNTWN